MCAEVFRQSVTWTHRSDPLAATGEQLTEIYLADVTHPKPSACTAQQNQREKTFWRASLSSAGHISNIFGIYLKYITFYLRQKLLPKGISRASKGVQVEHVLCRAKDFATLDASQKHLSIYI